MRARLTARERPRFDVRDPRVGGPGRSWRFIEAASRDPTRFRGWRRVPPQRSPQRLSGTTVARCTLAHSRGLNLDVITSRPKWRLP